MANTETILILTRVHICVMFVASMSEPILIHILKKHYTSCHRFALCSKWEALLWRPWTCARLCDELFQWGNYRCLQASTQGTYIHCLDLNFYKKIKIWILTFSFIFKYRRCDNFLSWVDSHILLRCLLKINVCVVS